MKRSIAVTEDRFAGARSFYLQNEVNKFLNSTPNDGHFVVKPNSGPTFESHMIRSNVTCDVSLPKTAKV